MANHVYATTRITGNKESINKLYELLNILDDNESYLNLINFLNDAPNDHIDVIKELDRDVMCDNIGAKWLTVEEVSYVDDQELILNTTTAWGQPYEMWARLTAIDFEVEASYADEMPNFMGYYTEGEDYGIDYQEMVDAIERAVELIGSDLKEGVKTKSQVEDNYGEMIYEYALEDLVDGCRTDAPQMFFNDLEEQLDRMVDRYLDDGELNAEQHWGFVITNDSVN